MLRAWEDSSLDCIEAISVADNQGYLKLRAIPALDLTFLGAEDIQTAVSKSTPGL